MKKVLRKTGIGELLQFDKQHPQKKNSLQLTLHLTVKMEPFYPLTGSTESVSALTTLIHATLEMLAVQ